MSVLSLIVALRLARKGQIASPSQAWYERAGEYSAFQKLVKKKSYQEALKLEKLYSMNQLWLWDRLNKHPKVDVDEIFEEKVEELVVAKENCKSPQLQKA